MGMMTEYYHFFFTTLVREIAPLKLFYGRYQAEVRPDEPRKFPVSCCRGALTCQRAEGVIESLNLCAASFPSPPAGFVCLGFGAVPLQRGQHDRLQIAEC